jgi:hypothetical protein
VPQFLKRFASAAALVGLAASSAFSGAIAAGAAAPVLDGFTWSQQAPSSAPAKRGWAPMAEDANGRVLLFGGSVNTTNFNDTWEWDGSTWTQLSPATSPPVLGLAGMAYVPSRHRTVLFGAQKGGASQTWEFDGSNWAKLTPATSPPARMLFAMAASNDNKVVLFGGQQLNTGYTTNFLGDTWVWDGTNWTQVAIGTSPAARAYVAMSYDPLRGRDVMFGGHGTTATLTDTWEWNGTTQTWTQANPATSPPDVQSNSITFDGQSTILFGGSSLGAPPDYVTNFSWEWDGVNWRERLLSAPPNPRWGAGTAFNSATNTATLFGGCAYDFKVCTNDTWSSVLYPVNVSAPLSLVSSNTATVAPDGVSTAAVTATVRDQYANPVPGRVVGLQSSGPAVSIGPASGPSAGNGQVTFAVASGTPGVAAITATDQTDGVAFSPTARITFTEAARASWSQVPPRAPLHARAGVTAFDTARNRLVLFTLEGAGYGPPQTWELNGTTWTQLHPVHSPSSRRDPAMTYDAERHKTVLFGGTVPGSTTRLNETWTWNGTDWTQHSTPSSAGSLYQAAMAFDRTSRLVVLYDGSRTWAWNGSSWAQVAPTLFPPIGMALASNPGGGIVGFWGTETWKFAANAWTRLSPATSPSPRTVSSMVLDPGRGRTVLFGGTPAGSCPCPPLSDTWEWDGTTWTMASGVGGGPDATESALLAFNPSSHRTVLLDPATTPFTTWTWNGTTWSRQADIEPPAEPPVVSYDVTHANTVLFAGGQTWTWDGTVWSQKHPAQSPRARRGASMVFDRARGVTLLFGGGYDDGSWHVLNETWKWDGTNWTQVAPATSPPARSSGSMAYDSARSRVVLFGGTSTTYGDVAADTWEWNGTNWRHVSSPTSPPARANASMAFDALHGRTLLFGGRATGPRFADTWAWDGVTWTSVATTGPAGRTDAAMVYDGASRRVLLLSGQFDSTAAARLSSQDQWAWGGDAWIRASPIGVPGERYGSAAAYDAARQRIVLVGGIVETPGGASYANDTWLGVGPPSPPVPQLISPTSGPAAGGQSVTISGALFQQGAKATVNGVPLTGIVVSPDGTHITGTMPAHAAGPAAVTVTNPDQQYTAVPGSFTYT